MKTKRKSLVNWTIGIIITIAVVYGFVWLVRQNTKEELGEAFPNQGQQHIEIGAVHPAYNSNPPTSGWHYASPANWDVYQDVLPDEQVVHNLEHGGIWISYKNVDQDTKTKIEELAKKYPNKLIVTPRPQNESNITLASWTRLLKLDRFDEAVIVDFMKANKNRSPEPNAQ